MTRPLVSFRCACLPFLSAALTACGPSGPGPEPATTAPTAAYIGSEACGACHAAEAEAWNRSHHYLAMQEARAETILGDFSAATFEQDGTQSAFEQSGEAFLVRSNAASGEPAEFPVAYTFGFEPLQQYLLEMPDGRLQAFTAAWDARPETADGQRWFDLHAGETIESDDPLHWTGLLYNWNGNCAECHSTGVIKGYDAESDTYSTRLSEVNVGCEACHGPGSNHAASPSGQGLVLATVPRAWAVPAGGAIAERVPPVDDEARAELEVCAGCHSRRGQLTDASEPGDPYLDGFRPALLTDPLYHADGQIQDEVFVYGSFLQSRMHAAGVTCSDCHEPHSGNLRADGNAVCGQCHLASEFDTREHHRHEPGAPGSRCVGCHMPAETYMVVDPRRDHSFRVPRPDLTVTLGTPNACADCHQGSAEWAAGRVAEWFPEGRSGEFHYAEALAAGRRWSADRRELLSRVVVDAGMPAIVRATAMSLLGQQLDDATLPVLRSAIDSSEPLLELAAIDALAGLPAAARPDLGQRFLTSGPLALRVAAALSLLPAREALSPRRQADLDAALAELDAVHRFNADRPEGLIARAGLELALGRPTEAEATLSLAIERAPAFTAAYVNLADLYRALGREPDAERTLREGLAIVPDDAGLLHALGLSLVRAGRDDEALPLLERAAGLDPDQPHYAYVYGVALNTLAGPAAALEALAGTHERFPGHADTLVALATIHRDAGNSDEALRYATLLEAVSPASSRARGLIESLR
ncbi:MAG TPA: tetratricopeptide repeat protein [Gammaproteobacteria bacterium]|nr:tetratricopeptide repeat protein [Gammaproteobacteria bacterium]